MLVLQQILFMHMSWFVCLGQMNHVFDQLSVTRYFNGLVLTLEEDHYVAPDFIPVLNQMYRMQKRFAFAHSFITQVQSMFISVVVLLSMHLSTVLTC